MGACLDWAFADVTDHFNTPGCYSGERNLIVLLGLMLMTWQMDPSMIVETRTGSYAKLIPSFRKRPDRSLFPQLPTLQGAGDSPAIPGDLWRPRPKHTKVYGFFPPALGHSRFKELNRKKLRRIPKEKIT